MKDRKDKERIAIAIALGFYAKFTRHDLKSPQEACEEFGLAAWMNDVDCQVAFRKGFQEAEERLVTGGNGNEKLLRAQGGVLRVILAEIQAVRHDLIEHMRRQLPSYGGNGIGGGGGGGSPYAVRIDGGDGQRGGGGSGGPLVSIPDQDIEVALPSIYEDQIAMVQEQVRNYSKGNDPAPDNPGPFYMRDVDQGSIYCRDWKPQAFTDFQSCLGACVELHKRTGRYCEPISIGQLRDKCPPGHPLRAFPNVKVTRVKLTNEQREQLRRDHK